MNDSNATEGGRQSLRLLLSSHFYRSSSDVLNEGRLTLVKMCTDSLQQELKIIHITIGMQRKDMK